MTMAPTLHPSNVALQSNHIEGKHLLVYYTEGQSVLQYPVRRI